MVHAAGRELTLWSNPGPAQATLQRLHGRVHEDKTLRSLEFLCKHRVKLVQRTQAELRLSPEIATKLFYDVGADPVVLSLGIPIADDPGGMEFRLFCCHESAPLEFRHKLLILVKDLNEKRHLTESMG